MKIWIFGFTALLCASAFAHASDAIVRDGWSYDREDFRELPDKVDEVRKAGKGISLRGGVEYDFEVPKTGWYSLWLGGSPAGWPRDISIDGKTVTRLEVSAPDDEVKPMPRQGVQYKEANIYLTRGKHVLRIQRLGAPGALPTVWELRPSAGLPGDTLRATVEGSRIGAPGDTVEVKFQGGDAKSVVYELLWRNEATGETLPAGSVGFPEASQPVEKSASLMFPAAGLYTLVAKADGEWLRTSDLKAGYFLSAPVVAAPKGGNGTDLQFAGIFRDGVILQRQKPLPVWGWAKPGQQVTVSLAGQTEKTRADALGRWLMTFQPVEAGSLGDLKVAADGHEVVCHDVLAGEVWLLSGQSNMGGPLLSSIGGPELAKKADFPDVRLAQLYGTKDNSGDWRLNPAPWMAAVANGNPKNLSKWNAIHFAFGTELNAALKVPVGVISGNRGGTFLTTWASTDVHQKNPSLKAVLDAFLKDDAERVPEKVYLNKLAGDLAKWKKESEKAATEGKPAPPMPTLAREVALSNYPALNYDSLIKPLAPFAIRGVLWYQGESDSNMAAEYRKRFPALIQDWRDLWKNPEMPFLFVQIAYGSGNKYQGEPGDNPGAELKEAQMLAMSVPHTAMVVTNDLMKPGNDVHYPDKLPVGHRLAQAALATVYGRDDAHFSGPIYKRQAIEDGSIRLFFDQSKGLAAKDGSLGGFAIAGEDRKWVWADAKIDGETVVVSSPKVPKPVAVRYSWAESPSGGNLVNEWGLPSPVFRTDDWPMVSDGVMWDQKN